MKKRIRINGNLYEAVDTSEIDPEMYEVLQKAFMTKSSGFRCHTLELDKGFKDKSASYLHYSGNHDVVIELWVHLDDDRKVDWQLKAGVSSPMVSAPVSICYAKGKLNSVSSIAKLAQLSCYYVADAVEDFIDGVSSDTIITSLLGYSYDYKEEIEDLHNEMERTIQDNLKKIH